MTQTAYNLSEDVREYFEFEIKGHIYQFRHLNSNEMEEMKKLDQDKLTEHLFKFITKKNPDSPDFSETSKLMIMPEWANFKKMMSTEFGI